MRRKRRIVHIARRLIKSVGIGMFVVFLFLLFYLALHKNEAPFMMIVRSVLPLYSSDGAALGQFHSFAEQNADGLLRAEDARVETFYEIAPDAEEPTREIVGMRNVVYQPETDQALNNNAQTDFLTATDIERLKDFDYLKSKMYTVDRRTGLLPGDIDVDEFLAKDLRIDTSGQGPKVLIFHTHSQEAYKDSEKGNINDGIFAAGDRLAELLENTYGIKTLHDKSSYDVVDGKSSTQGAYERMEAPIQKILSENPSIEVVIDMHRDGVSEDIHFQADVNGQDAAKIMFFNGLCRLNKNGELVPTQGLSNEFVKENLAFSFRLQLLANELYPGLTRKIYCNAYRYSLHFKPKSILVEVGAQTNTKAEALNAMTALAEVLAKTIQ